MRKEATHNLERLGLFIGQEFHGENDEFVKSFSFLFAIDLSADGALRSAALEAMSIENEALKAVTKARKAIHRVLRNRKTMMRGIDLVPLDSLDIETFVDVAYAVEDNLFLVAKIRKSLADANTKRGGYNAGAEVVARITAQNFHKHGHKVSFGQSFDGKPSTSFCRTVEFILELLEFETHWRRPAERAFRYALTFSER